MNDEETNKRISDSLIDNYSDYISGYSEYDGYIAEYDSESKREELNTQSYFESSILDDPLIKDLEENNIIMDTLTQNGQVVSMKNEFIYVFDGRIISRYKVLHNASILKDLYGYLNKDMLMASIVRNSFMDENTFKKIKSFVFGERSMKK